MRAIEELFAALAQSTFRSRFQLSHKDAQYLRQKGLTVILDHARQFIFTRLADANPAHDGRQTPMRNHPVFTAQHATGTCCRKCLEKWHHINRGSSLTQDEVDYIIRIIEHWLRLQPKDL